jgi:hypothetical protein
MRLYSIRVHHKHTYVGTIELYLSVFCIQTPSCLIPLLEYKESLFLFYQNLFSFLNTSKNFSNYILASISVSLY